MLFFSLLIPLISCQNTVYQGQWHSRTSIFSPQIGNVFYEVGGMEYGVPAYAGAQSGKSYIFTKYSNLVREMGVKQISNNKIDHLENSLYLNVVIFDGQFSNTFKVFHIDDYIYTNGQPSQQWKNLPGQVLLYHNFDLKLKTINC